MHVSYKIRDREIGFMTHGRDYWDRGITNRTRDSFFIEGPQIFNRSAAAADNNHIDPAVETALPQNALMMFVKRSDRAHNFM